MNGPRLRQSGLSMIELMVALALGLFLTVGVIAVFSTTSTSGRTQSAIARMLENGRYASQVMNDELRMAGAQYCAAYGRQLPTPSGLNPLRPLMVNVSDDMMRPAWIPDPPTAGRYALDPAVMIRGHECNASGTCTPSLPSAGEDVNIVPAAGLAAGNRARGTDVLTIRYLAGRGVTINGTAGTAAPVGVTNPASTLGFPSAGVALIASCGQAELFAAARGGNDLAHAVSDGNYVATLSGSFARSEDARVFNFARDFRSVTYYIGLSADPENPSRLVHSLMRIVNGAAPEVVVEGVERLDFSYAVLDGGGGTHYLSAAQVQSNASSLPCPPVAANNVVSGGAGCLWRAVQGIEVSMLVNSLVDDGAGSEPFRYSPDGTAVQSIAPTANLVSGLPAGRMQRREFRFLANVHNVSP